LQQRQTHICSNKAGADLSAPAPFQVNYTTD
jgi:hypothetical protein